MMVDRVFGHAGTKVVIEERLDGREVSVFAITDGRTIHVLLPCQDHKRLCEHDVGPNTGGMGVLCPSDAIDSETMSAIEREILVPTIDALKRDKIEYQGVLYAGLMLTPSGPKVIEYNVRFGDPECQTLMVKLKSDLLEVMLATTNRSLGRIELDWDDRPAVCVVLASEGYPQSPRKGDVITGTEQASAMEGVELFYAGVKRQTPDDPDSPLVTAGGRVISVVAMGDDWEQARQRAYRAADVIDFAGKYLRRDIGLQYVMHATTDNK
jgi:phosphoribosylamine--glycine ligase